jgi:hypothetical protein
MNALEGAAVCPLGPASYTQQNSREGKDLRGQTAGNLKAGQTESHLLTFAFPYFLLSRLP